MEIAFLEYNRDCNEWAKELLGLIEEFSTKPNLTNNQTIKENL